MKRAAKAWEIALTALLIFAAYAYLAGGLASLAVNERLMLSKMEAYSDTAVSQVDAAQYPALAKALTGYLDGKADSAQLNLDSGSAFSEDELIHLADVKGLVSLGKSLRSLAVSLLGLSLLAYFFLRQRCAESFRLIRLDRAFLIASLALLLPILLLGLFAAISFDAAFALLHRLAFRNELWLLDPQTDLLLQLMPERFFISYGWDFLKQSIFLLLAYPLVAYGLRAARRLKEAGEEA